MSILVVLIWKLTLTAEIKLNANPTMTMGRTGTPMSTKVVITVIATDFKATRMRASIAIPTLTTL